ncbi:MAG: condensation domain-containing protein, partial [Thermodesulfovibrionales bacterium]
MAELEGSEVEEIGAKRISDLSGRIVNLSPEKRSLFERHLLKKKNVFPDKNQAILRRGTSDPCVLSFSQERLWLYDQLEPDMPNIIPYAFRMRGDLYPYALEKALDTILDRHEVLRTNFSSDTGETLQVIHQHRPVKMTSVDLGMWPEPEREHELWQIIDAELKRLFDLSTDLMLRATLIRLSDREHILVLTIHHIASDGWSVEIFFRELLTLYGAFTEDKPSPLPDLPIQYADFACWQRKWMKGEVLENQLSYWQEQLADIPEVLALPLDRPRPAVRSLQGLSHGVILPEKLVGRLKGIGKREGVTMFTLMMAAFKTLLYRYTNQVDICVGTFVANRNQVTLENLIGFFVNTLVLRTDLSDDPSFRELLQREHQIALGAFANQDVPFEKLLEVLNPRRDSRHTPLFQVALSFENMPKAILDLPNLSFEFMPLDPSVSLYDMTLIVTEITDGMEICFTYRSDIFDASTIKRWAGNFLTLLESIVANPEQRIETLPLLTEAEKRQVVEEWNNTAAHYPEDLCIHEMFEAQVEKTPDAIAVVYEGQELTYGELNSRANQLAHYLRKLGVGTEVLVGICVDRSLAMLVGLLGILKAGGAYVPLDPAYPKERLSLMLEDADISVLLTQERHRAELPLQKARLVCLDT